jgi:hypothetical protein
VARYAGRMRAIAAAVALVVFAQQTAAWGGQVPPLGDTARELEESGVAWEEGGGVLLGLGLGGAAVCLAGMVLMSAGVALLPGLFMAVIGGPMAVLEVAMGGGFYGYGSGKRNDARLLGWKGDASE